jgi:hypothetical protein
LDPRGANGITINIMRIASRIALVVLSSVCGLHAQANPENIQTRDAAIRAFNESPSLSRFSEAGVAIMEASGFRGPDLPVAKLPKNRAFEAMKAKLATGIVVAAPIMAEGPFDSPTKRVTLAMLPQVRPSFFARDEALVVFGLRPFKLVDEDVVGLIDGLSSMNKIVVRVRVASPMEIGRDGPSGAWDVDSVDARFEREAVVNGVTREGRPTGYKVQSVMAPIGYQPCSGSAGRVIGSRVNPGWSSAIIAWIGRSVPANAIVVSRVIGGTAVHSKLVVETVDLDRDGVPEFSIWGGIDKSDIVDEVDIPWKVVFVNRGGRWVLGDYRSEPDCT